MIETEVKFQVPTERADAVVTAVRGGSGAGTVTRLQASYFDTDDRVLAAAGVSLRIRREGVGWVQTVKVDLGDTMARLEHNVERTDEGTDVPALDLTLHTGTAPGKRLARVVAKISEDALTCQYRTDIVRTSRRLHTDGSIVELAFDVGHIQAGDTQLPVCELEFELIDGAPQALLTTARPWVARHGLWLDTRSKAERGVLLARAARHAPERKAEPVTLKPNTRVDVARRAMITECLQQVAINASQVASGDFADPHVHQLRVGLRRMRTALRLLPFGDEGAGLAREGADLFRALGAARNQAAISVPLTERLTRAIADADLHIQAPSIPFGEVIDPTEAVRSRATQMFLLDLISSTLPNERSGKDPRAAAVIARRLDRWHRRVVQDARSFTTLDHAARHRLRKRAKRLRYGLEFGRSLFGSKRVARYIEALSPLQQELGNYNDLSVAIGGLRGADPDDVAVAFALGWLTAQREAVTRDCASTIGHFIEVADRTVLVVR